MKLEIELPSKYGRRLEELEKVDPTIRDQIEVEVLPEVLRLINDGHRQLQEGDQSTPADERPDTSAE